MSIAPASATPVLASLYACLLNKKLCNSPVSMEAAHSRTFVMTLRILAAEIFPFKSGPKYGDLSLSLYLFLAAKKSCVMSRGGEGELLHCFL